MVLLPDERLRIRDPHHLIEAQFKAFARALRAAGLPVGPGRVLEALRAVERAVGRHQAEFDALSGPWPDALDPSGELGMVAAGLVPQLAEQIVAPSAV